MSALVVPGVRVQARFDVLPPLPAPSGVIGMIGIIDRPTDDFQPVGISRVAEIAEVTGPGTPTSMPELAHALANGAAEVIVAPVMGGAPAQLSLSNLAGNPCVLLKCRSNGAWGNQLHAEVQTLTATVNGNPQVMRANLRLFRHGRLVEEFRDLLPNISAQNFIIEAINRHSNLVVAVDPNLIDAIPAEAPTQAFAQDRRTVDVAEKDNASQVLFTLSLKDDVPHQNLSIAFAEKSDGIEIEIERNGSLIETFAGLQMDPDHPRFLPYVLEKDSATVRAHSQSSLTEANRLPRATVSPLKFGTAAGHAGSSPTVPQYQAALAKLQEHPRINLVLAAIESGRSNEDRHQIHQSLRAHAALMADRGAPCIGFGAIAGNEADDLDAIKSHAALVRDRRFVLVTPPGAAGALAGMVGRLQPSVSPTFKGLSLFSNKPSAYRESQLNRLLGSEINACVIQERTGRGVVVLRGLDTTGDQISVTRVADAAIRETKAIADGFIGRLNNEEARTALRQQIVATFTRMERAGALVPSTDGSDPAFLVDVHSSQQDFAQGIVRIDIAVRPVRAIDFIYATIRVKN